MKINNRFTKRGIITHTLGAEGGYVNKAADLGAATKYGCTEYIVKAYRRLWDKYNFNGDMRTLPYAMAYEIYEIEFWGRLRLDAVVAISGPIADQLFEWMINSGSTEPGKAIQEHLNASNKGATLYPDMVVDGLIGPTTLRILRTYIDMRGITGIKCLLQYLLGKQTVNFYEMTVSRELNEEFYTGWLARGYKRSCELMDAVG